MSFRALRTGVSGLKANQTRLDVVGNNISNVNTVAFKRGRAAFAEVLGQKILGVGRSAGGANINPSHVGRGVSVSSIDQNWSQGSLDQTGVKTDLALSGDGFFVASPQEGVGSEQRRLARAGNFTFNQEGELVTSNGLNVQGWAVQENAQGQDVVNTGELKDIKMDPNAQSPAKFTSTAEVGGNLSAEAEDGNKTSISSVIYDEQGTAHNVVIEFTKNINNGTPGDPSDDNPDRWDYTVKAADGSPFQDGNGGGTDGIASGEIVFNAEGSVESVTDSGGNALTDPNGDPTGPTLTWNSEFVSGSETLDLGLSRMTQFSGSTTAKFQSQNGHSAGELSGFSFTPEGELQLNYTNGEQEKLFQLAIGNVNNPNGLEQQGQNFYTTTSASGSLQLGRAGRDLRTSVVSGSLESSNVELATEFSELIVAQRGYQASARIVTTSDEVLQETVQLKR